MKRRGDWEVASEISGRKPATAKEEEKEEREEETATTAPKEEEKKSGEWPVLGASCASLASLPLPRSAAAGCLHVSAGLDAMGKHRQRQPRQCFVRHKEDTQLQG